MNKTLLTAAALTAFVTGSVLAADLKAPAYKGTSGARARSKTQGVVMNKILLGTTLLAGLMLAGAAQAADMPLKAPRPAPVYSDWTGFYIGVHGGYGWGRVNGDAFFLGNLFPFTSPKPRGGLFGGQAGYLWQWGSWVAGFEVDYSAADLRQIQTDKVDRMTSKIDALGSARARLGWLWTPNLLAYGTAGVGWAHSKLIIDEAFSTPVAQTVTSAQSSFGWVTGAGLEYQFANNWRLRAEYLHYGFGTVTYLSDLSANVSVDVVRGGLSYKF